ncbi:hypothetical protein ID866_9703 [Astraeus odoratus]|nr:hypothetical protein ID866_9703 [Astraeus odoratus]
MALDPRTALQDLAQRASRYRDNINLDGRLVRDDSTVVRGGYATVYPGILRTEGTREGIKVAIKTARGGPPGDEETIKEVHLWSKLSHPNVLPLLGITTQFNFTVSIVSRWMGRGNARQYVQHTGVDPRPLIEGIAQGLYYLHTHESGPIFHGDMKGYNVLISDDGRALLTDFGLSYIVDSSFSWSTPGGLGGTISWMAPESLDGHDDPSAATDVWGFAMTALELLTRADPFSNIRGIRTITTRIFRGPPDRPSNEETCGRLTEQWWKTMLLCWEQTPTSRPTMSHLLQKIRTGIVWLFLTDDSPSQPTLVDVPPHYRSSTRLWNLDNRWPSTCTSGDSGSRRDDRTQARSWLLSSSTQFKQKMIAIPTPPDQA